MHQSRQFAPRQLKFCEPDRRLALCLGNLPPMSKTAKVELDESPSTSVLTPECPS